MYTVEVYNKNKKLIETYHNIHTITYIDTLGEKNIVTGDDLLTHYFPPYNSYQLFEYILRKII